jgi:Protein-tyrosine phosphatase
MRRAPILTPVEVIFPDGTRVRASSIFERDEAGSYRDFGLYMDPRWAPTWPAEIIDWPDFGLPPDAAQAAAQVRDAFVRAKSGQVVEVGCLGGLGRTGTVLACMAVLAGVDSADAIAWVRQNYRPRAIETADQERWVEWFAQNGREVE